jgi:hypothetical protein
MIGTTFWKKKHNSLQILWQKHDWQHILGKNMIAAHSGKNQDCQHILGENMIGSIFWKKK